MIDDHSALRAVFADKYENPNSDWVGNSGPGSDAFRNIPYRAFLENFIRLNAVSSVVDIGCGDWQFSRYLDWRGIDYRGFDLVQSVVDRNNTRFGSDTIRFDVMPSDLADIPGGHLLIMKDVLQHLPTQTIHDFVRTVFPKFVFCLLTNSYSKVDVPLNTDIPAGDFRCLDLRVEPFHLSGGYVLQFSTGVHEELRTLLVQR